MWTFNHPVFSVTNLDMKCLFLNGSICLLYVVLGHLVWCVCLRARAQSSVAQTWFMMPFVDFLKEFYPLLTAIL